MADLKQLEAAFLRADAAGDIEAATVLAKEVRRMRGQAQDASAPDPSQGGGTLQFGPFDTGIKTSESVDRFLSGAGKAFADIGRGAGQWVGAVSRDDVSESRLRDAPLMKTGSGLVGNIAGNIAALAPAALVPGANTIAGGAAIGAATGALQPSESAAETAGNIGIGGLAGTVVPAATRAIRAGRALAEPLTTGGQERIVGRALNRAAGNDAAAVAARLRAPNVFVPGSNPTVGQAAENAGVAALERAATATNPEVTNAVSQMMQAQNAARVSLLDDLAGTAGARDMAGAARSATADQLYETAYQKGVDLARDATTGRMQSKAVQSGIKGEITKLLQRPAIQDAVKQARTLAANEGVKLSNPAGSVKGLDYVKRALDDQISKATGNEQRILVELKSRLLTTIDRLSPDYAAARQTFADMSRPLNQMDVVQAIRDRSVNALTGNLQPAAYARQLNDTTARSVTGMRNATLDSVLDPSQMQQLNNLLLDVQRANAAQTVGRGVGSDTVQKLAYTNILEQSGVPTFLQEFAPAQVAGNLLGRGADAVYGRANRELANRLAAVMLDPQQAAALMQRATPAQRNALAELARIPQGLMLAAPASANSQ